MQNAGDLDAFNIFAGERVELTPGALLGLQGPDGSLTGSLNVVTDGVLAAGSRSGIGAGFVNLFRSEEHTSELQSLMRISYAVFCLKKKTNRSKTSTYNYKRREQQNTH